jgi:hypothetical protein
MSEEGTKTGTWFDNVAYCSFEHKNGELTSEFYLRDGTRLVWTGDEARLSKRKWELYFQSQNSCVISVPPEILQKISTYQAELTE